MSFKSLIEMGDKTIREEIGNYYYISKSRMEELIRNFEQGAKRINELSDIIKDQQEQILILQKQLVDSKEEKR